jgi:Icc-related predicted phosphoesterase
VSALADYRLFFATDIHGSDRCFRKFLNAARFYSCDVLVMGGDITGKMLVPIVDEGGGRYRTTLFGRRREVGEDGLHALRKRIADAGYYPYDTTPDQIRELDDDPAAVERVFRTVMEATLRDWLRLAEERLEGTDTVCLLAPGNDDPPFIGELLRSSPRVLNPEGMVVELPGGFPMISVGYSNPTPWASPRELTEEALFERIEREASKLPDTRRAIFNLHVPPKETPIDQAVDVDEELRPRLRAGSPVIVGVGSKAVRRSLEDHQPMLGLHGHIHESRGEARLGRTLSLNPGSEYSEGILRGAIVTLSERKGVRGYQLVAG